MNGSPLRSPSTKKLNLGCGRKRVEDAINLDITPATRPDLVHDLNSRPWPFANDTFDEVLLHDVLEHLDDVLGCLAEVHRVCRPGGVVRITTPHFSSPNAFTDPTHRHYFGFFSLDYLTEASEYSFYAACRYRIRSRQLFFHPSLLNKVVWRVANRWPAAYERRWAWIFPAWFLGFELEVVKQSD